MKILHSPALHFIVLGGVLFGLRTLLLDRPSEAATLVVPVSELARLAEAAQRQVGAPPTREALDPWIRDWVDEELLVREARARGWHRSDAVVQRRLIQNMRFLARNDLEESVALEQAFALGLDATDLVVRRRLASRMRLAIASQARETPSEADLATTLERHRDRLRRPARARISQVFLSRDRRGEALRPDALALLAQLRADGPGSEAGRARGDPSLLPAETELESARGLASRFGPDFAAAVFDLAPGGWQGPVESSYGLHLVQVHEREPERAPHLAEVRGEVITLWRQERERRALRDTLERLRRGVDIRIEGDPWKPRTSASSRTTASP